MRTLSLNRIFSLSGLFILMAACLLTLSVNFAFHSGIAHAAIYTIDTATDDADGDCGGVSGDCSLRDAIIDADSNPGQDTIVADPSVTAIALGSDGPSISEDILDCNGALLINGLNTYKGLRLGTNGTIKGCTLRSNLEAAIYVDGNGNTIGGTDSTDINYILNNGINLAGDSNTIINNYIGLKSDGNCSAGAEGIVVASGADSNVIGGDASNERNIISCQSTEGILIQDGAGSLTISGNYIGTDVTGASAKGGTQGISFQAASTYASAIIIGGTTNGEGNVISGSLTNGIEILGNFTSTLSISRNVIGTNAGGSSAVTNSNNGIYINGATCGTLGNCSIEQNVISGNTQDGIKVAGDAARFQIWKNKIGTNSTGASALANGANGIHIGSGSNMLIGTTDTAIIDTPNVISGNTTNGIYIAGSGSSNITISENYIGFNAAGTAVIANGGDGIHMTENGSVTIGNSSTGNTMNVIVGNADDGTQIDGNVGAVGIYANGIGATTADYGNGDNGIEISGTPTAVITIGNSTSTGGNLISGNTGTGIYINDAGSQPHVIKGNYIGTDRNATTATANDEDGIIVLGSNSNITIGSVTSGEYNIIAGNGSDGIELSGIGATVIGNYIGTNSSLADLGNTSSGIKIANSATGSTIGYAFAGILTGLTKANYIGFNGSADITVDGAATTTNSLRGNIFSLAAGDTSTNMSFTNSAQSGLSNSGVSTVITDEAFTITLSGLLDGSKVDFYTVDGSYATTYEGTATASASSATLSGTFNIGDTAYYQIITATGTSYPFASAGTIVDNDPTGLLTFTVVNSSENLGASWDAATSPYFDHYEIWYGTNLSDVENRTGTATEWDNSDDSNLATASTTSTSIVDSALDFGTPGITYYAKLWAYATTSGNSTLTAASYFTGISGGSSGSSSSGTSTSSSTTTTTTTTTTTDTSVTTTDEATNTDTTNATDEPAVVIDTTDTDNDGLYDSEEVNLGTDPKNEDSDKDGIKDGAEVKIYKTNPLESDTDGDGYWDKYEIFNLKSDPNDECDPGDATASEEKIAECAKKLAEEAEIADKEEVVDVVIDDNTLKIDEELLNSVNKNIEKLITGDFEWVKRYFKQVLSINSMQIAYSNSPQIKKVVDSFITAPSLNINNGEAISVAMAIFNEDAFNKDEILNATTNAPFVQEGFNREVLNSFVNKSFNSKEYISRGNALRLMFRVSGLKLNKQFGLSLYENFGVKSPIFSDLDESNPAISYILYFQSKGLLQGYTDGVFQANDYMQRAEFIKLISIFYQEVQNQKPE